LKALDFYIQLVQSDFVLHVDDYLERENGRGRKSERESEREREE